MTTYPTFEIFKRDGSRIEFTSAFASDADARRYVELNCYWSDFAKSLLEQLESRGRLSDTQWAWVHKVGTDHVARQAEKAAEVGKVKDAFADRFEGIRALVDRAFEAGKKFPRIDVTTAGGQRVVLARAGDLSKRPGTINITDGRPFGQNTYFGSIDLQGVSRLTRNVTSDVRELLRALDADPSKVGSQHGVATGVCCFCNRDLTDARSRSVGYGPICAEKFGLDWGDVSEELKAADAASKAPGSLYGYPSADHVYPEGSRYCGD